MSRILSRETSVGRSGRTRRPWGTGGAEREAGVGCPILFRLNTTSGAAIDSNGKPSGGVENPWLARAEVVRIPNAMCPSDSDETARLVVAMPEWFVSHTPTLPREVMHERQARQVAAARAAGDEDEAALGVVRILVVVSVVSVGIIGLGGALFFLALVRHVARVALLIDRAATLDVVALRRYFDRCGIPPPAAIWQLAAAPAVAGGAVQAWRVLPVV